MTKNKEYGGYIELDTFSLPMLYDDGIKLNCGRNALAYLIEAKEIKSLYMPYFLCDSCDNILRKYNVQVKNYTIYECFKPNLIGVKSDDWVYVVNFYGQLSNEYILELKKTYSNLIVDNAQAYFQEPVSNVDTLYTCRKFFGVSDGAVLYTDSKIKRYLSIDESYDRMGFLLGRYERSASEFYSQYVSNNRLFSDEPIKAMSKLTNNLLHAIDYEEIKLRRRENFIYYHNKVKDMNNLKLVIPDGAFSYPLWIENGLKIRSILQHDNIYIPTLWPSVFEKCEENSLEYNLAANILPLPCDQRYDEDDIDYILLCLDKAKSSMKNV